MNTCKPAALTLALALAFPGFAMAQSAAAMQKELKALQDRITELEKKLAAMPAPAPAAAPRAGTCREAVGHDARAAAGLQPHLGEDRSHRRQPRRLGPEGG